MAKTFEQWRAEVDALVSETMMLGIDDLPDMPYRDWFDDGISAEEAAERVYEENMPEGF